MTREERVEVNDISLSIGELRSDARNTRDAVIRIEKSIDKITGSLSTLPPSPTCLAKHIELEEKISELRVQSMRHATIISGVIAGVVLFWKQIAQVFGVFAR